ncbi:MAG: hypothetical protein J6R00_11720 [Lentisphaeria bacterium]|nr:hypothetical protein [Lentisphaeria bacterium]
MPPAAATASITSCAVSPVSKGRRHLKSAGSSYSAPSYNYSSSGSGTSSTTRRCSIHGETYDIRFGSGCAWCRQPDYGSGKTTTAKCPRHNYYYDPSIGCPICR